MSDHERFDATREAVGSSPAHTGPTPDRYQSALQRYLNAVESIEQRTARPESDLGGGLRWNVENNLVREVMTGPAVSVGEDVPFKEIVATLARHRIGAVPVVDADQKVVGVVSESDLLAKVVTSGGRGRPIAGEHSTRRGARRKAQAETAGQLMTSPAVTVATDCSVVQAARTAARARVRRLPVLDLTGVLVGIVTRSDLLRVFLRGDEELRAHLVDDVLTREYSVEPHAVEISVLDGVVTLTGQVEKRIVIQPLLDTVRATSGVVAVHDQLTYRIDDTALFAPTGPLY
jgi:CBS domain-containing protein